MVKKIGGLLIIILFLTQESLYALSEGAASAAPPWLIIPFVLLLLMIATGPLFYEHYWHQHYAKISILFATLVVGYYLLVLHDVGHPIHALLEYVPFISFLAALFIASGGISIKVDIKSSALANSILLLFGAVIANIIGTTGASMLLIRPFINMNRERIQPFHIIFFIFIISNVGGSLTPIGDPPLFLGFLKGVPFEWTFHHNFFPWLFGISCLLAIFYIIDKKNSHLLLEMTDRQEVFTGKISFGGSKNFVWLALTVASIFLDPNILSWVPSIPYHGAKISFVKEIIWVSIAFLSYKYADKDALEANRFDFEPIKEVGFLFIGIFGTMMPAIAMIGDFAENAGSDVINTDFLFWGTGLLSGFLDNAPTYLNFLTAGMASNTPSLDIANPQDVLAYSQGLNTIIDLNAISIAAVFFGAMTYIGNGPNFMVKSIAENVGIGMPTFFAYLIKYSIPYLLPVLAATWAIFFSGWIL